MQQKRISNLLLYLYECAWYQYKTIVPRGEKIIAVPDSTSETHKVNRKQINENPIIQKIEMF